MNSAIVQDLPRLKAQSAAPATLRVRVHAIRPQAMDINAYEVVDPTGRPLPPSEAGSHVDVHLPDGTGVRQYSLCGDPKDGSHYVFAVQREPEGRGGSKAIFDNVRVDSELTISQPRNKFPVHPEARHHLLIAGGIGITPMMSMLCQLQRVNADFTLHYCTRSPERTAFLGRLRPLVASSRVFIHWDGGDPAKGMDIEATLREYHEGTHLYYCGPPGFMRAVAAASSHWPCGATHREYFTPSADDPAIAATADMDGPLGSPFRIKIASTGLTLDVPGDKTILQVLREQSIAVETACELGVCGTCRTRFLEGEAEHRDFVLEVHEQETQLTVCCSRAKSPLLVLDL